MAFWHISTGILVKACVEGAVLPCELLCARHDPSSCRGQTDREGESVSRENIPTALRLRGHVSVAALEDALAYLIKRHEVLRARYVLQHGIPLQVCKPLSLSSASACKLYL